MNKIQILVILAVVVLGALVMVACNKRKATQVEPISPREAFGEQRNDFAVIVDVREESEVKAEGMAEGAIWLPTSKFGTDDPAWKDFLAKHPKDKKIVVHCAAGGRAGKVASKLSEDGYKTANMGGFKDWVEAGLPIKKP